MKKTKTIKKNKVVLPLLQSLISMTPGQRTIILNHLDETTLDKLVEVSEYVLTASRQQLPKDKVDGLSSNLLEHKCDLQYKCNHKKSHKLRRQRMKKMGGFPLGLILSAAIPMLMNLISK